MHQFYLYAYPDRDPSQLESRYMSCLPHHRNDINLHLAPSARGEPSRWRGILSDGAYGIGTAEGCDGNKKDPTQLHRLRDGRTNASNFAVRYAMTPRALVVEGRTRFRPRSASESRLTACINVLALTCFGISYIARVLSTLTRTKTQTSTEHWNFQSGTDGAVMTTS
jgi:hypothetical protein